MKRSDSSLRAGADGEHADDGADAEDDAERGQQRAGLLRAEVGEGLADIGEADHLERAFMAPFCLGGGRLGRLVGIGHRDDVAFIEAGEDGLAFAAPDQFDVVRHEAVRRLAVDEGAAVAFEDAPGREPRARCRASRR